MRAQTRAADRASTRPLQALSPEFGPDGHILRARGRTYFWEGIGPLSIKAFFGGTAHYRSGAARFAVHDGRYLVLGEGQEYTLEIDSPAPVESYCVFFPLGLAEDVQRGRIEPLDRLLDDPAGTGVTSHVVERTYPHDDLVTPLIHAGRSRTRPLDAGDATEFMHRAMAALLRVQDGVRREANAIPAARPATREELYRRLHLARDYIDASLHEPISLDTLAGVAGLSPNHLLRTFPVLFGATPHRYLVGRRVAHAQRLLRTTELSVTEICFSTGFESLGSFSSLFKRSFGVSPSAFRKRGDSGEA